MDPLLLICLTALLISGGFGFLWRKGILTLLLCCLALSFTVGVMMQINADPPQEGHLSLRYLWTLLFWFVPYYLLFFLVPSLAGAAIGVLARRRTRK
jgi:hypothetical protein